MRFLVLQSVTIINQLFICLIAGCQAVRSPYNHGKRELNFANYPQQDPNVGRDFRRDFYNYYQQRNTIDDAGFTKQQDDNQTAMFTKAFNENPLSQLKVGNTTNIHNFLEFNNPPGQMFHLIYMPMSLNKDMTKAIQLQGNEVIKMHYNKQPVKDAQNLQFTGPQQFPVTQAPNTMQPQQQQQQPQAQSQPQNPQAQQMQTQQQQAQPTTPAPAPYYNHNRPFAGAGSMTTPYQQTYNTAQFPPMPLRAPATRPYHMAPQMTTKMEAPFIPSQFLGYTPQIPAPTMRPFMNEQSNLIKPVQEANEQQAKYNAGVMGNPNNAGNMVYMPANNYYDMFRNMQKF